MSLRTMRSILCMTVGVLAVSAAQAELPNLEVAFSTAQVEKGAPKLVWTKTADGGEMVTLAKKEAGIDLDGVVLTRRTGGDAQRRTVTYTLENVTKELRYASVGFRCEQAVSGCQNWVPTTENVLNLDASSSLWGYYVKPGPWFFSLVEPWMAAYNAKAQSGFAFIFDWNHVSAVYAASDMKTRGAIFDGGMLPPGAKFTTTVVIRSLSKLGTLATVNDSFAAGFMGPSTSPSLTVLAFRDLKTKGAVGAMDMNRKRLGGKEFEISIAVGEVGEVGFNCEKANGQIVLRGKLDDVQFEQFRENGVRMASLPMVPAIWPYVRTAPAKVLSEAASVEQKAGDKALLFFGFYANFFRFPEAFPELKFTIVPAPPEGILQVPPASTIGEYKYVFVGDVNEESLRPVMGRLAAYVKNGGTLVVAGGPFSFGCGNYAGSFLESMLPVKTHPFDCLPACASDRDGRTSVKFSETDSTLFWIQRDSVKEGAEVLLKTTTGDPLLVKGTYGKGRVFAFLATPLGDEARDGKVFWKNPAYFELVRSKFK